MPPKGQSTALRGAWHPTPEPFLCDLIDTPGSARRANNIAVRAKGPLRDILATLGASSLSNRVMHAARRCPAIPTEVPTGWRRRGVEALRIVIKRQPDLEATTQPIVEPMPVFV